MNDTTFQGNGKITYVPVVVDAKPKPITNADAIRDMTDEELAEVLCLTAKGGIIGQRSKERWLDWLRQETEVGET